MKLSFIGAGKMAEGMLQAAARAEGFDASAVLMAEKCAARAEEMARKYGVAVAADAKEAAARGGMVVLAVRPQDVAAAAAETAGAMGAETLLVSIAAGVSLAKLRELFGPEPRLVRVMPNLALRAKEGMCAVCAAENAREGDVEEVRALLDLAGRTVVLEEKHFDAVTALSGSGPAFYAHMEKCMAEGGVALGLPADAARLLAEQTMLGTAAYLRESGADLGEFIAGVATPGGTTEAGMNVLKGPEFAETVARTLKAAADRAAALGGR